jgi:hypothetical protein
MSGVRLSRMNLITAIDPSPMPHTEATVPFVIVVFLILAAILWLRRTKV